MATGRVPTTANSPLTTKGDLFGYSTAPARLAVGADGETIVADSAATTGLRYSATPSASNPVINSAMQVWQRGTSIACSSTAYTADRWQGYRTVAGATVSRQTTSDTTNLPFIQYAARVQRDSANTSTTAIFFAQSLESVNAIPFVAKVITVSFYARSGANYSSASSGLSVIVASGTGTDQNVLTSYTGANNFINQAATLTTTWQRFSYSGTVPTTATELGAYFYYTPVGTAGANDYFEVTGVQIDIGSVALPFRTYAATIQGELAACQRYLPAINGNSYETLGFAYGTTGSQVFIKLPTTARVAPTGITVSNVSHFTLYNSGFSGGNPTAIAINTASIDTASINVTTTAGSPTIAAKDPVKLQATNASALILFTGCEL